MFQVRCILSFRKIKIFEFVTLMHAFLFILSGCSNGNPIIKSLGIFNVKSGSIEFKIPAGDSIQVAKFTQSFKIVGTCPTTTEGFEFSLDEKTYTRFQGTEVTSTLTCNKDEKFELIINDLSALAQKLTSPEPTKMSADSIALSIRSYSHNGFSDSKRLLFTTVPGISPMASGGSLNVTTHLQSSLGLISGTINPSQEIAVSWNPSLTSVNTVFAEVSADGGGTWIPIAKGENSGKLIIPSDVAREYLTTGAALRLSELSGGSKVIVLSPTLKVQEQSLAEPSSIALVSPAINPSPTTNITLNILSSAGIDQTVALFSNDNCSSIISSKTSSGSGIDTINVNDLTTDGSYPFYAQIIDGAGNRSKCSSINFVYNLDKTPPVVSGLLSDSTPRTSKTWSWSCIDANGPCTYRWEIRTTATSSPFSLTDAFTNSSTATQTGGDATYYFYAQAKDKAGNISDVVSVTAELNSSAPGISFSSSSLAIVRSGTSFYYDLIYANIKAGSISLTSSSIVFIYTGTASGCAVNSINDTGIANRRVNISGCGGDGTVAIKVASGSALSPASVPAAESGNSPSTNVDNTPPAIAAGTPSTTDANASISFTYPLTITDANSINLNSSHIILSGTGATGCIASVINGTTANPNVQISGCIGNGPLKFNVVAGVAVDVAGNTSTASTESLTVDIDNIEPTIALGAPDKTVGNTATHFHFPVTYSGASTYNLTPAKVSFSGTSTGCTASISEGTTASPTIDVTGCSGNGNLQIFVGAGAATDAATNATESSSGSNSLTIDNIAPTLAIESPSHSNAKASTSVTYSVTYSGANTISLSNSDISFIGTGATGCTASVSNGTTSTPTVAISGCSGNGPLQFKITAGTATDTAGNLSLASTDSVAVNIDNTPPTIAIGSPSSLLANASATTDFPVTYTDSTSMNLIAGNVLLSGASEGCSVAILNGTTTTPTIRISGCTSNGGLNFTIQSGTASDIAGNLAPASSTSGSVTIDNTLPVITGLTSSATPVTTVNWNWSCTDTNSPCLFRSVVSATSLGTPFSGSDGFGSTTTASQPGGNGTYYLYVQAKDPAGNLSTVTEVTAELNSNKPGITIGLPSPSLAKANVQFYYDVLYSNASSINLSAGAVTFNYTGSVSGCTVNSITTPADGYRRITINSCSGDGSVSISLAANTALSPASMQADSAGPSSTVTIDNTKPTLSINSPNLSLIKNSSTVSYVVSFSPDSIVNLQSSDIQLGGTDSAGCLKNVLNGTSLSPTVEISGCSGNGNMQFSIIAGAAHDLANNLSLATANSAAVAVDNSAPTLSIGSPNLANATSGSTINFPITYSGADSITLTSGNVTINSTGNASCSKSVVDGTTSNPVISLSSCAGDGTVSVSIGAGTASDNVGNLSLAYGPSAVVTIDNTLPTLSISAPNYTEANASRSVSFSISYSGGTSYSLSPSNIALSGSATNGCIAGVSGGTTASPTVTISGCTGNGVVHFDVNAGATTDLAGNSSTTTGPSQSITIDNQLPTITLGSPSVGLAKLSTSIDILATYSGEQSITLTTANINLIGASADCTKNITGTGSTRTLNLIGCTGNGSLKVSIAAGTAIDGAGNSATLSNETTAIVIDNTAPTLSIATPSPTSGTTNSSFLFSFNYTGADTVNLSNGDLTLNSTGTVSCNVPTISGGTTSTPQVSVSNCTGDGTIQLSTGANTATDTIGNSADGASSTAATIDNTPPTLAIGAPSMSGGNSSTNFSYTITYTGASTVSLNQGHISFSGTATTGCSANVTGTGNSSRTVDISGCTGNGDMAFSIAAESASDTAGNLTSVSSSSTSVVIDNLAPTLSWGSITPTLGNSTTTYTFNLSYSGHTTVNLLSNQITTTTTGTISGCSGPTVSGGGTGNPSITVTGCNGNGTLALQIASGSAFDLVGNQAPASALSSTVTIDNSPPVITIGSPSMSSANSQSNISYGITVSGASTFNLINSDIIYSGTATADCTAEVSDLTFSSATVTVTGCKGNGPMHINIKAGVASDSSNNSSLASEISSQVTIDNQGPSVAIGSGSPGSGNSSTHFQFGVSYSGAISANLTASDVSLQGATADCAITITNGASLTPTVDIFGCTGDDTLQVRINAGVALDSLSNPSADSSWSTTVDVINAGLTLGYNTGYSQLEYKDDANVSYYNSGLGIFSSDQSSSVNVMGYKANGILNHYEAALGTTPTATNISTWANIGTSLSTSVNTASLSSGHQYFSSIRAIDSQSNISSLLSAPALFMKYTADGTLSESSSVNYGSTITVSSDGLRMLVGDPSAEKVYVYQRASGTKQHWSLVSTLTAAADSVYSVSGSQYGASHAILHVSAGKYLYIIGAPLARTNTGGTTRYAGRIYTHFESSGTMGALLQTVRSRDILNQTYESQTGDEFGSSLAIWNDGTSNYLLVGAPGMNCMSTSGTSCGSTVTDGGAIYSMSISCPSSTCSSTSLVANAKYVETNALAGHSYGLAIKSTESAYIVATSGAGTSNIYVHTSLGNSTTNLVTGLTLNSETQIAISESNTSSGKPLVAYLDATGILHLGKFDGSTYEWKTGTTTGWTSISLYSDTTSGSNDSQGISFALGDSTVSARAVMGLVDWNQSTGYSVKQDLAPLAAGINSTDQFGKSVVIFDNYISITAPNANKVYNFY